MARASSRHACLLPRLAAAALLAAQLPSVASAQQSGDAPGTSLAMQGLLPGSWYLGTAPAADAAAVAEGCAVGMIIAPGDGRWLGVVGIPETVPPQVTLSSRARCDEGPKGALCTFELIFADAPSVFERLFLEFDVTEAGHYRMRMTSLDADEVTEFYPQRCPEDALERMVIETLSAMP